ncbi:MAG: polyprenyl synthetase family protein [Phycisphaerales bacterium]|jgi:octaprenyl-diphosphate synthase|nr:polyprenyl synthetase family protein [Phycisphaerales bacterium]
MSIFDIINHNTHMGDWLTAELDAVSMVFDQHLASEFSPVNTLCIHTGRYRGKMLRPSLVLLSGMAMDGSPIEGASDHRTIAAVTEMIHMATLVHDDVLDESPIRRSAATLNALHGNEMAVILGDYLISNAFHLCSTVGDPAINARLGEITNMLCEGEIVQLANRENLDLSEDLYFSIVTNKTASLIGGCCELGGRLSGADTEKQAALYGFGRDLGIAFQITDDLLDLTADQKTLGKTVGRDLDMGKLTLPLIRALRDGDDARGISALVQDRCHAQLQERLHEDGWFESAQHSAVERVESAKQHLDGLPDNAATTMLRLMADAVIQRRF